MFHLAPFCCRWCSGDVLECNALMDHKALKRAKTATNFLQTGAKNSQTVSRAALSHGIYGIPVFCCSQNGWRLKVTHKPVSVCHAVGAPRACSQHFLAASSEHFSPSTTRYVCVSVLWWSFRWVGARGGSGRCSWVCFLGSCPVCEHLGGAYLPCSCANDLSNEQGSTVHASSAFPWSASRRVALLHRSQEQKPAEKETRR